MKKRVIILTDDARDALERVRDTHPKPYMRERAAAILQVASGASVNWVAQHGLLKRRYPKAVYKWVKSYRENGLDGLYAQRGTFGVKALVKEMYQVAAWVRKSQPPVSEINLIWDCWSCHFHPEVQLAASKAGITLIPLPTYAPWENPIEKLWRWLCQEVLHMHDCADAWRTLWERVDNFLQQFENGSQALLQYVGLLG
jgi:transposase